MNNLEWIMDGGDFRGWLQAERGNAPESEGGPISGPETAELEPEPAKDGNGAEDAPKCAKPVEFDGDTREKLVADAGELVADYAASGDVCKPLHRGIIALLDRQEAITERKMAKIYEDTGSRLVNDMNAACVGRDKLERRIAELEAERDALESTANTLRASVAGLKDTVERQAETLAAQRGELARFNAEKRGTRAVPKGVKWPRDADGRLVHIGWDGADSILFERDCYTVTRGDGLEVERGCYRDVPGASPEDDRGWLEDELARFGQEWLEADGRLAEMRLVRCYAGRIGGWR